MFTFFYNSTKHYITIAYYNSRLKTNLSRVARCAIFLLSIYHLYDTIL